MFLLKFAQTNLQQRKTFVIDRPNGTPFYDLVFFKTKTDIEVDGKMVTIGENTMILYDKYSKQHYYTAEDCLISDFIHFDVSNDAGENLLANLIFDKPFHIEQSEAVERILWLIAFEYYNSYPNRDNNSSHLLSVLIKKLEEEVHLSKERNNYGSYADIISAKNRIMQNPQYNWNIKELAESCSMSESYFQIAYKKLFGSNCISDVIAARLEMAKELIHNSSSSIQEIASCCGYNNIEHFSRQFKRTYGITPLKYRNIHKESKKELP